MTDLIAYLKTERGRKAGIGVFLAGLSALFTFSGYEMIRSPSESIFLDYFTAQDKAYALSLVPLVMFFFIYLYGRALSAWGSMRAMSVSMSFAILSFFAFYLLLKYSPNKPLAFLVFVFKESYVVILSEQYWSYINSVLKDDEGRLFNGPVAGLGALGSLIGGWFVSRYVSYFKTDLYILFSGLCLLPALWLFRAAYRDTGEPEPGEDEAAGKKGHLHLSILKENRTVLLIALMIFTTQVVATLFDINFTGYVKDSMGDKDLRTAFLGDFWMKVNIVSFSMQFLLTPLILKHFRIKAIQVAIPLIHIATSLYIIAAPGLFSASLAFLLFKSMDYSIFRASKEILYIPFSYDTRYRAKQVADAFTYRFSKGTTSVFLSLTNLVSKVSIAVFPIFTLLFSGIWTFLAFNIREKGPAEAGPDV
ncbi:MAG: hypothetical protein COT17_04045 [Elusimicrobia bacterium CG08_land_8_20_14_0_20_51_18]|nr:MAG: hypothetical protein COT17_04045 [Elusimicrobia bacterium CG08_land_8_20_14_0_20_51_18]